MPPLDRRSLEWARLIPHAKQSWGAPHDPRAMMVDESPVTEDVFGKALWDWTQGGVTPEVLERDDGFMQEGAGPDVYLSKYSGWPAAERKATRSLRGRVLDVGCGAGRVSLELQRRGMEVVALDPSPLAARSARYRGVKEVWC